MVGPFSLDGVRVLLYNHPFVSCSGLACPHTYLFFEIPKQLFLHFSASGDDDEQEPAFKRAKSGSPATMAPTPPAGPGMMPRPQFGR